MLLVLDVGNTNTVLGVYDMNLSGLAAKNSPTRLLAHWRVATIKTQTVDEYGVLFRNLFAIGKVDAADVRGIIISSVVPPMDFTLREVCERYFQLRPLFVEPGVKTGMPVLYENPAEVGADRIINGVAAFEKYGGPCVAVDFGTATTFDAINERGDYVGGAIAPGIEISVEALSGRGALLRKIELVRPRNVIGKNTVEGMQSGVLYGFAGQVDGLVTRMARELSPKDPDDVQVIATGGLAPLVLGEAATIDVHEPWLTLIGLRLIYERNRTV
jgi:type III pantothenate kinase